MNSAQDLLVDDVRSFIDSDDMRALSGEHGRASSSIPLINKHLGGLGCQTKTFLAFSLCLYGLESCNIVSRICMREGNTHVVTHLRGTFGNPLIRVLICGSQIQKKFFAQQIVSVATV